MTDKPAHQCPELPDFWDHRFKNSVTPWDAGGVPQDLRQFAAEHGATPHTLIPGCGSAWEARWLLEKGWPVTALDFSAAAIDAARAVVAPFEDCLLQADFFDFPVDQAFDLIYERAFLCALPRKLWPGYAPRCAELLKPGGLLAGYFFIADTPKGPPFGISPAELDSLLLPFFARVEDREARDSIPVFAGSERWQVWQRR